MSPSQVTSASRAATPPYASVPRLLLWAAVASAALAGGAVACGGSQAEPQTAEDAERQELEAVDPNWDPKEEDRQAAAGVTSQDQIALGATLFAPKCGGCHGDSGEGGEKAPRLIGEGALPGDPPEGAEQRTGSFVSAQDLYDFVSEKMPPGDKKLGADEAWAVVAFMMKQNGADLPDALSEETASSAYIVRGKGAEGGGDEDEDEE